MGPLTSLPGTVNIDYVNHTKAIVHTPVHIPIHIPIRMKSKDACAIGQAATERFRQKSSSFRNRSGSGSSQRESRRASSSRSNTEVSSHIEIPSRTRDSFTITIDSTKEIARRTENVINPKYLMVGNVKEDFEDDLKEDGLKIVKRNKVTNDNLKKLIIRDLKEVIENYIDKHEQDLEYIKRIVATLKDNQTLLCRPAKWNGAASVLLISGTILICLGTIVVNGDDNYLRAGAAFVVAGVVLYFINKCCRPAVRRDIITDVSYHILYNYNAPVKFRECLAECMSHERVSVDSIEIFAKNLKNVQFSDEIINTLSSNILGYIDVEDHHERLKACMPSSLIDMYVEMEELRKSVSTGKPSDDDEKGLEQYSDLHVGLAFLPKFKKIEKHYGREVLKWLNFIVESEKCQEFSQFLLNSAAEYLKNRNTKVEAIREKVKWLTVKEISKVVLGYLVPEDHQPILFASTSPANRWMKDLVKLREVVRI